MDTKLWRCSSDGKEQTINELINANGLPRAIAMYLASRDMEAKDVDAYFNASFADLSDPFCFPGMDLAVRRLWEAVRNKERILIHGDYDTDGITSTALVSWVLEKNGGLVSSFLPHRFDDGYGFTPESLNKALETIDGKCGVLVTVDCGINSAEAVAEAKARGIDVIITDHHEPAEELPQALAIINPKITPELTSVQKLSGVGVAFKLAHAFLLNGRENGEGNWRIDIQEVLDYVALGTIADIVPLVGENRILVKYGMETLKRQIRPGVRALIEMAHLDAKLQPSDITFKLAPRINAAGRLGNAISALQLMTSTNIVDAYRYAGMLDEFNQKRQAKEQEIFTEAKKQVESDPSFTSSMSIVAAGQEWHQGVIGIVASRFARDYNKPAIVLTIQDGEAHGSGRSTGSLNLIKILSKCAHLLTRYGGHPMAVGLGLKEDKIPEFKATFEACVREEAKPGDLIDTVDYDGEITLDDVNDEFFEYCKRLAPFGHGNPNPVYRFNGMEVIRTFPIRPNHTKGIMRDREGRTCDFIAFNMVIEPHMIWDVTAVPHLNDYYGEPKRQLQIQNIMPSQN